MTRKTLQKHLKELECAKQTLLDHPRFDQHKDETHMVALARLNGSIMTTKYYLGILSLKRSPANRATYTLNYDLKCVVGTYDRRKK